MNRDVKDIVGVLMRVLDGGEVSQEQLAELSFEADGALRVAINEAYIKLMEFAFDLALRRPDPALDRAMRAALQRSAQERSGAVAARSAQERSGDVAQRSSAVLWRGVGRRSWPVRRGRRPGWPASNAAKRRSRPTAK